MRYKGKSLKEISFPLGGIGTGSIGLGGDGRLIDWEIFNKPSKGSINGYSHFAIRAIQDGKVTAAVLNGDIGKDYMGQYQRGAWSGYGFGPFGQKMCGFPHFRDVSFNGEFPIAELELKDENFPAEIKMTAFNPFIPLDEDNSSIPAAFFEFEITNNTQSEIEYQLAFSAANPYRVSVNKSGERDGCRFITMYNAGADKESVDYGDLTVATDCDTVYRQTYWYRGEGQDGIVSFWNDLTAAEPLRERTYDGEGEKDTCTLAASVSVCPNEKKKIRFVLSWNAPRLYDYWADWSKGSENRQERSWKNYYATVFESSTDSAVYSLTNWDSLYSRTLKFKNALHNASLPEAVIAAASSNLSVLKTATVWRLEDGSFYGWEGLHEVRGSCEGTCQHVYNYAYALCFLFPRLERSIRDLEFKYSMAEDGRMAFRLMLPLGSKMSEQRACVDGQMGAVIKSYREWKISGDSKWLADNWENIKKALEYAMSDKNPDCWDRDCDGVLEGRQHNTLDAELFGPSSWLEGMYLAALRAAAEMAEFLGDTEKAREYGELFDKGYKWTRENLFNGKYFIQRIDVTDKSITDRFDASDKYWNDEVKQIKYQICEGSSIDQVLAQWHADIIGLGEIFDREQLLTALKSMMKNNYKPTMRNFANPWRIFSVNDEAGSVICVYPEDAEKPKIPIQYCEETMTGFEYSFAGILCSRGMLDDGFKVVRAVRDRFDGEKRNPWNEFECGSNYARSMASYALVPILSGFEFDMPHKHIGFKPYKREAFQCVWSVADAWGNFSIFGDKIKIEIYEGSLTLKSLGLKFCNEVCSLKIDGRAAEFEFKNGRLLFDEVNITESIEAEVH